MKRALTAFLIVAWVLIAGCLPAAAETGATAEPTTIVFVRHAEKAKDDPRDPGLSESGVQRAEALATLIEPAGVTHLFASEFKRTQETLRPLSSRVGIDVTVVSAREPKAQVAALRGLPAGSVAVVAGHSNTVPGLLFALGGEIAGLELGENLDAAEYDRMFVLFLPQGGSAVPQTVELRYGE